MKLGRQVHVTLVFDKINGSTLGNVSAKSNMTAIGHPYWSYLGKCLADFHYIGVNN